LLIVFDLDDTLIDTSGAVTPFKMQECLKKCIAVGLPIVDFSSAYQELLSMNRNSLKSIDALKTFMTPYQPISSQIDEVLEELFSPLPESFCIPTTPCAKEILEFYKKLCPIALVTGGDPSFQWEKLKKAGIDSSVFSMIGIPEDSIKKPYYQAVQKNFAIPSREIWVCGDRIEMDLRPAFELGFRTIHMRWGRGTLTTSEKWIDHSISELSELKEIIR